MSGIQIATGDLNLPVPIQDLEKKSKLDFYFHTSLWCLKRFYEGLNGLIISI